MQTYFATMMQIRGGVCRPVAGKLPASSTEQHRAVNHSSQPRCMCTQYFMTPAVLQLTDSRDVSNPFILRVQATADWYGAVFC